MSTHIPARSVTGDQIYRGTDVSGEDIQHILIADSAGNLVGTATADPAGGTRGLVVRNIPGGVQPVTDNGGSLTVDAPVGTPAFTRLSDGTAALTTTSGRLSVDASGVAVPITDNSGSLTVDAPVGTPVNARLSDGTTAIGTTAQRLHVDDGGSSLSVDDNASSLTVDAPVGTPVFARLSDGSAALAGQKVMASSLPVAVASDQGTIPVRGSDLATTTGTITTSTGTVTTGDVTTDNNVTVLVYGAAHAGLNLTFEVSPDAGTNWTSVVGARVEGTGTESVTGVLTANSTRAWEFTLPAVNRFRVRATAYTSGTLSVIIGAGSMPLEPVVNAIAMNPPGAQLHSLTAANAAYTITTEALRSLVPQTNLTASGAATTFTVPAGKTLRILGFNVIVRQGATTSALAITFNLRAVLTGTVAATSPIVANAAAAVTNVVGAVGTGGGTLSQFLELPSGASYGVSDLSSATSAGTTVWVTVNGIIY